LHPARRPCSGGRCTCTAVALLLVAPATTSFAAVRTWVGNNNPWNTSNANWSPADEPDSDDTAVFNTGVVVDLANASETINGLTMSGGADLDLNGNDLTVNGLISLTGSSTRLFIGPAGSILRPYYASISSGATFGLRGGTAIVNDPLDDGFVDINAGGTMDGSGNLSFNDAVLPGTRMLINDGTINVTFANPIDAGGSGAGTLTVNASDSDALVDLDGDSGNGVVTIARNDTLALNVRLPGAAFTGVLYLNEGATMNPFYAWELAGGAINVNTVGLSPGTAGNTARIAGGAFTQTGGGISLDGLDTLTMAADFNMVSGSIINLGRMVFEEGATIHAGADFFMTGGRLVFNGSGLTVSQVWSASSVEVNGSLQILGDSEIRGGTFTGTGALTFGNEPVFLGSPTTINMPGTTVDLEGDDIAPGPYITKILAPLTIRAAAIERFGHTFSTLGILSVEAVDGSSGRLTVQLDDPNADWAVDSMSIHGTNRASLIAGNGLTVHGTFGAHDEPQVDARLNILGNITITLGRVHLNGGDDAANPNRLSGGTIKSLGAPSPDPYRVVIADGKMLSGYGTVSTGVIANGRGLLADDGMLTVTGPIEAGTIGTADSDGIFNRPGEWIASGLLGGIRLNGGEFRGGRVMIGTAGAGIHGHGLVTAPVSNNGRIAATDGGTLVFATPANDNDWNGNDIGFNSLQALENSTLELRDDARFVYFGDMLVRPGGRIFANGFALEPGFGSRMELTGGTFQTTQGIPLDGTVIVHPGAVSTLESGAGGFVAFQSGSATTLGGDLRLQTGAVFIYTGASFSGNGALLVPENSIVTVAAGADIGVLLHNRGHLRPGGDSGIPGRMDLRDYQQTATGTATLDLAGTALNQYDRLVVSGAAQLAGSLTLRLYGGYVPAAGDSFAIVSAGGGVLGQFTSVIQPAGLPPGLTFAVNYTPFAVTLLVQSSATPYDTWMQSFPSLTDPAQRLKSANPDADELNNLAEFALDGHPASGAATGRMAVKVAPAGGTNVLTLTIPVRAGAVADPADPPGGELVLRQSADGLRYRIQSGSALSGYLLDVSEVTGADAAALQAGLAALNPGWVYRTFRGPGSFAVTRRTFLRAVITE